MRELNLGDTFKAARMIAATNATEEIKKLYGEVQKFKQEHKEELTEEEKAQNTLELKKEVGTSIISFLLKSCTDTEFENQLYDLIAGVAEKEKEDIRKLKLREVKELFVEIAKKNDLESFFSQALDSESKQ